MLVTTKALTLVAVLTAFLVALSCPPSSSGFPTGVSCPFNGLCSCSNTGSAYSTEVLCINAPLTRLPRFPPGQHHYYRVSVIGSKDIYHLGRDSVGNGTTVSALTVSHTRLHELDTEAFRGTEDTLTTVDLSHNRIRVYPALALSRLQLLQWLSLKGNQIEELKSRDFVAASSSSSSPSSSNHGRGINDDSERTESELRTLLLGDNRLSTLHDQVFSSLKSLQTLDLAGNTITRLEGRPFPSSLTSLSLSQNLLSSVPLPALSNLNNLRWLQLRGNVIRELPQNWFLPSRDLEILDLSNNLIANLSVASFAASQNNKLPSKSEASSRTTTPPHPPPPPLGTSTPAPEPELDGARANSSDRQPSPVAPVVTSIRDFLLDFNLLQTLPGGGVFKELSVQRLSLSNNMLSNLPEDIFEGPLKSDLRALDLNFNVLTAVPRALSGLSRLTSLFLRGNRVEDVSEDAFNGSKDYLQSLDMSSNLLTEVPAKALRTSTRLLRLNLQDNLIRQIDERAFGRWAGALVSLSLSKNSLQVIEKNAFKNMGNLRELRLSFNDITQASPEALLPLRRSLAILELSYAIGFSSDRVMQSVSVLDRLEWLELDHNRLKRITPQALSRLPSLQHCDLEGNSLVEIPSGLFDATHHSQLRNIILSHNKITIFKSRAFSGLQQLVNIVATGNRLESIEAGAFVDMPLLQTVIMTRNRLSRLEKGAFRNLSRLAHVFLQENKLNSFSVDIFDRAPEMGSDNFEDQEDLGEGAEGPPTVPTPLSLYINVSYNEINTLIGPSPSSPSSSVASAPKPTDGQSSTSTPPPPPPAPLRVRVFDVSHNNLSRLPVEFVDSICEHLQSLDISHNRLSLMPLSSLRACGRLQLLSLNSNQIYGLDEEDILLVVDTTAKNNANDSDTSSSASSAVTSSFGGPVELQVLEMSSNLIKNLSSLSGLLTNLGHLKILDLSYNQITSFEPWTFAGLRSLEKLLLSGNKLSQLGSNGLQDEINCLGLMTSLRHLDLTDNYLSGLQSVSSCEQLVELRLAGNDLVELREQSFAGLSALHELDLSNNGLKKLNIAAFVPLQRLLSLSMNNCSMQSLPHLPLPQLIDLRLAHNRIANVSSQALAKARLIKLLDLSGNQLSDVPRPLWRYFSSLTDLDLSANPIEILDSASFSELRRLRYLNIAGLALKFVDSRMLHSLGHLTSISTSTYPAVRSFRLHDLLAKSTSLRTALIEVQESTLSHQIQWAFGPKLKELVITGPSLVKILPDAFLVERGCRERVRTKLMTICWPFFPRPRFTGHIGLNSPDLVLRITETNVTDLPAGLLRYLTNRFALIDLRKNKLQALNSDVLQFSSVLRTNRIGSAVYSQKPAVTSFQVTGGLLLNENPWSCSCNLLWLSSWLRRWLRETRKYHMLNFDVFLHQTQAPLQGHCSYVPSNLASALANDRLGIQEGNATSPSLGGRNFILVPLIDLYPETVACSLAIRNYAVAALSVGSLLISALFNYDVT